MPKKQENMQNIFKMEEIMHNQLTESDIKKMQEEIEYRKLVVRKEALEDVKEARAQGDLSENFEYYAAKKFKNKKNDLMKQKKILIWLGKNIQKMLKNVKMNSN